MLTGNNFSNRLISWHRRDGRKDLPWQQNPTAYRVWVSEIMLQQTQVATVIPYFNRFIESFPGVLQLANAAQDDVLHHWSGLGYYARARNLHQAAKKIRDDHGGRFPETFEQVLSLPGIGRSTAGAVLSLSLGQPHPILDGNVKRVLIRFFAIDGWPGTASAQKRLWGLAEKMLPRQQVGTYNQALMDLGAGICTRGKPVCADCPLLDQCQGYAEGDPARYPQSRPRKRLPQKAVRLLLLHLDHEGLLLERRPPSGIWGGLWSLPECELETDPTDHCKTHMGLQVEELRPLPARRHTFTHFHLDIHPLVLQVNNNADCVMDGNERVWYNTAKPDSRGLAAPVARLIEEFSVLPLGDEE